ncbi:MAG TPA: pro-sigmaK processing inhibitor BofA family protein [Acetivibrio sp.]|uniref:pro-sigmaK processing inhibitor BofA family protein n=1 Tax=Acetivibrio sp. TaxID=1872092 RepID=UPI002B6F3112|nr:pro-sigmaK processing inhibitor BofA family protein [Acetivibrio sp.]HOM03470.1 pro-sigmaK processing inhibitor BofA family protein [Acetivibrio sp.]
MAVEFGTVSTYVIGIVLLYFLGKYLVVPMKTVLKLVYNGLIGAVAVLVINFVGGNFGFQIALNPLTSIIVGTLGVPGVLTISILKYLFGV